MGALLLVKWTVAVAAVYKLAEFVKRCNTMAKAVKSLEPADWLHSTVDLHVLGRHPGDHLRHPDLSDPVAFGERRGAFRRLRHRRRRQLLRRRLDGGAQPGSGDRLLRGP